MKRQSRAMIGHVIMTPFMLGTIMLSVLTGRQKAVHFVGRILTAVARRFVGLAIPSIPAAPLFRSTCP